MKPLVNETIFIEVILPLALPSTLTYRVPANQNHLVSIGKRAIVPFRKNQYHTGIIVEINHIPPSDYEAKYITEIIDKEAIVSELHLEFWKWISEYYMCTLGEVMNVALPSSLKLSGENSIVLNPDAEIDKNLLSDDEFLIIEALEQTPTLNISDGEKILGKTNLLSAVNNLIQKQHILIAENIKDKFKPLVKTFIRLNGTIPIETIFSLLEKYQKQSDAIIAYLQLQKEKKLIGKGDLVRLGISASSIQSLIEKDIFKSYEHVVDRILGNYQATNIDEFPILSEAQSKCLMEINHQMNEKDVTLLQGVTSSGKTQIYIHLIDNVLQQGKQALYLLPEIALTTQIIARLKTHFGNKVGVYHSKFNDQEKAEIWRKVLNNEYQILIGARSAIFSPFQNLGLIVVDEEHETSYKQQDPAPRYHARDAAIYLAKIHNAKILLGSATPSLESYHHATQGKYGLVVLNERFGNYNPPKIITTPIKTGSNSENNHPFFTPLLLDHINHNLNNHRQTILFQNRRGYVPILICKTCSHTPRCIHCDVTLTQHKSTGKLHCHYCGYQQNNFSECPVCHSQYIEEKGYGTEKIEEELYVLYPKMSVRRIDQDSTRKKNALQEIFADIEDQKVDIIVGTQMVAKGLDFSNVTLTGILNADLMLRYPDFRVNERAYQTLTQVSGRAGRRDTEGMVVIQTYNPENRVIQHVIKQDIEIFYQEELKERESFFYPPYCRIIEIEIKNKDLQQAHQSAEHLALLLKHELKNHVLGPESALIPRIKNLYIKIITIKIPSDLSVKKVKQYIQACLTLTKKDKLHKSSIIQVNVDPY